MAIVSWVSLAWLVALYIGRPELRSGLHSYVALGYLLLCWFVLARTKTLCWQSLVGLWVFCLPWAVAVGLIGQALVSAAGLDVADLGSRTAIAALSEESLNLVPLLAIVLLFPVRVRRFSVTDWLLIGLTTGLAFQAVEEFTRRDATHAHYSLSPISGGLSLHPVGGGAATAGFAGQHILTALVAVTIGFAIAAWRHARKPRLSPVTRNLWRAVAVVVPLGCWWLTISVHAGYNATQAVGSGWLTGALPPSSSVPWLLRTGWRLGGHGFGLGWLLLALTVLALLVDAGRQRNAAEEADDPLPYPFAPTSAADEWAGRFTGWAGTRSSPPVAIAVWLTAAVCAVAAYTVRDLVAMVVSLGRHPDDESRWPAVARGQSAAVMVRSIRAEAIALAAPPDTRAARRITRLVALAGLGAVLVATLWLGPYWAKGIGAVTGSGLPTLSGADPIPWLAGIQAGQGGWWDGLALWQYVVLALGFLALAVVSAGPLDLPLPVQGGSLLLTPGSARPGASSASGDRLAVARSYLARSTPAEVLLDGWGAALGLVCARAANTGTGRDVRPAVEEFAADPRRFVEARRAAALLAAHPVLPAASGKPLVRVRAGTDDLPAIKLADGRLVSALSEADEELFAANLDNLIRGSIQARTAGTDYQRRIYGDDERLISQRPERWSDGQNLTYGMVGHAMYHDGAGPSWYAPQTLPESIRHKAYLELDRRLIEYATVVYYPANPFRALEIRTNDPVVAQALQERMARLAIPGYVVLEP